MNPNTLTADLARLKRIDAQMQQYIDDEQFAGIAWRIDHAGRTVSTGAVGHADHERQKPLTGDALFRIYSMTKPMVSLLALQLVEAGIVRLFDPISRYLPAFGQATVLNRRGERERLDRPITVEDVLTHRSGLSYDFLPGCAVADIYRENAAALDGSRSLSELVALLANAPLVAQPGTRWTYSYSTDVLAHLLEVASGCSLPDLMEQRLCSPLGMSDTAFHVPAGEQHRLMDMFGQRDLDEPIVDDGEPQRLRPMDVSGSYPMHDKAGFARGGLGLYSTLSDYYRFMAVLEHGKAPDGQALLSAPMVNMMWQNRTGQRQRPLAIGPSELHGYGWNLFGRVMIESGRAMKLSAEGEGGWAGAASTFFWVDRANRFSGLVLTQFLGSRIALGDEVQTLAYQSLVSSAN